MAGKHRLTKAYNKLDIQKADEVTPIPGILGFLINGEQTVEVPGRNGFVYVRLRDNFSEVTQAYNDNVSPVYGLPVLLVRDETNKSRYRVLSRDLGRYQNWGSSSPYLAAHGATHSFNPVSVGGDITWVFGNQFMPLLVYPSGTIGGGNALISPSTYYRNNVWHTAGGTGTASFLPYKPTGGNNAKLVLVYLDAFDNPNLLAGNEFSANITGTTQIFSYIPNLPDTSALPLSAVRLVTGTARILWDNLYDIRPFIVADGFIPTGTSGHIIQDEGVSLPNRAALDFIGTNVWAIDNPGGNKTDIIVSGSAGTGGGSLPDMQVGYGDGSTIIGNANFLFDDANELLSIGTANLTNLHDGAATLALVQEGASRPVINLDYYGSSGYPRIQFSSASGVATALGSVASGRALLEISAYGFITGSSGARWREGFEFFVYTNNPWTITGAASARAELYIKSITGSSASGDTQIMLMTREQIDFDTSLNISGTFSTDGFKMGRGASAGYILTTDAFGNGTWQSTTLTGTVGPPGPPGSNSISIYDDNVFKVSGTSISFADNLNVVVTGSTAYVIGQAGSLSASNVLPIFDNGIYKTTGTAISFDDNLTVVVTGTVAFISGQAGTQGLPGAGISAIYDDGVFLVSGTAISFDSGLTVGVTGTVAYINSSGRTLISEQSPVTGTSVTFSGIPGTYKSLLIELTARATNSAITDSISITFNGDGTASNYRSEYILQYAGTLTQGGLNSGFLGNISGNTAPAGACGIGSINIPSYAESSFYKIINCETSAYVDTTTQYMQHVLSNVVWKNASAITQITLTLGAGNFIAGTKIRLYGLS